MCIIILKKTTLRPAKYFDLPYSLSFKRDKNAGNFLIRRALKSNKQLGNFKCTRLRCKTCPFIQNASKISGPKQSININDRFKCIFMNIIYGITCTPCKKICWGETGRKHAELFREHLCDAVKNDKDASKPAALHFNLPNHSTRNMTICGLSYTKETQNTVKTLSKNLSFNSALLTLTESMKASRSTNLFICLYGHFPTNGIAPSPLIYTQPGAHK